MESAEKKKGLSRRGFLKGLPLGLAAVVGMGVLSRRLWPSSAARKRGAGLPKGSIFTPAQDPDRPA